MNCRQETFSGVSPTVSMLSQNDNGLGGTCVSCDKKINADTDKEWSLAQARVLLYLQALDIPAIHALKLALKALKHASRQATQSSEFYPTMAAMRALRNLLRGNEASFTGADDEKHQTWTRTLPYKAHSALTITETKRELSTNDKGLGRPVMTAPSINRGYMTPGEFDRKPWRSFFVRIFTSRKKIPSKPMHKNALHTWIE